MLLKFAANKSQVGQFVDGHMAWLNRGFDDNVFLLAGRLQPDIGGGILAHSTSKADLENRMRTDPFVAANIVTAEILEMTPSMADERLQFLID